MREVTGQNRQRAALPGGGAAAPPDCSPLCSREELPTIYKCPYQGCTAVYRGADGMKVCGGLAHCWGGGGVGSHFSNKEVLKGASAENKSS